MTVPATEPTTPAEPTTPDPAATAPAEPATPATPDLGDAGKKALEAERKRANEAEKARKALEAKVKEYEDASKTEAEKAAARAEAAESEASQTKAELARLRVALKTKLPDDLLEFLTGSDEDTLTAQAEKLMAATAAGRTTPRPDPTQGAKPAAPSDIDQQIADALAAGDMAKAISLKRQKAYAPTS